MIPQDPRFSTRWHRHDFPSPIARWNLHPEYEVHLITQGTGRFIVGDHIGTFAAGQLVLVGPDLPHHWISDLAPGEVIVGRDVVLQFHHDWITSCAQLMPELDSLATLLAASARGIEFLGDTAGMGAAHLERIDTEEGTARLVHTLALLDTLARAPIHERRVLANDWLPEQTDGFSSELVNRTLDYIFGNINHGVSLATAARMMGMSESAFSRYFKRASGHTFSQIVRKLRIARACRLLDTTDEAIAAVAQDVGYQNLSNFNRQFLSETRLTPSAWRSRHRDERLEAVS